MIKLKTAGRFWYRVHTEQGHEAEEVVRPPYKEYLSTLRTWGSPLGNPHDLPEAINLRSDRH